jgi:hypothetical protein
MSGIHNESLRIHATEYSKEQAKGLDKYSTRAGILSEVRE